MTTGFIVDYDVVSKFCQECVTTASDLGKDSPEFSVLYERHADSCPIDHTRSSGAMEISIAEKIWKRSEKLGFRDTTMLSDGDSKTYNHLVDSKIFGSSVNITKEECVNHVSKRYDKTMTTIFHK